MLNNIEIGYYIFEQLINPTCTGGVTLANGTAIAKGNLLWHLKQYTGGGQGSPVIRRSFLLSYFKINGALEPYAPAIYLFNVMVGCRSLWLSRSLT